MRLRDRLRRHPAMLAPIAIASWAIVAYVALPLAWTTYEHQRALAGWDFVTRTAQGIPGDPINIGLIGSADDVHAAMTRAGWSRADPVTFRSSVGIVESVIGDIPDPDAPVSPLYYLGVVEHVAFEQQAGASAKQRHHVRVWRVLEAGSEGRPVWLASVTFDRGVGLSHYTGQVTHHIAPDVDAERDRLSGLLAKAGMVETTYRITGVGPTRNGRNGGGDPYYTDGDVSFSVLTPDGRPRATPPADLADPPLVQLKNRIWDALAGG
jgi:hypothetical protein